MAFRHFPVRSSHPRAWPAACAAEAAALQGRFWEMHDLLFADQGRLEDPHLWERARALGLDLERFDADRRGAEVAARSPRHDFESGVRGGVVTTPTLIVAGALYAGRIDVSLARRAERRGRLNCRPLAPTSPGFRRRPSRWRRPAGVKPGSRSAKIEPCPVF